MSKEIKLSSGIVVGIHDTKVIISRTSSKAALKGLLMGRSGGFMVVKKSAITGLVLETDYLIVLASGMPSPKDFGLSNISDIKQLPNCIVGKHEELGEVFDALEQFF